jgi:hypothetical protein
VACHHFRSIAVISNELAERVGFEPTVEFPLHTLSKRAPSTTRTSLRCENQRFAGGLDLIIAKRRSRSQSSAPSPPISRSNSGISPGLTRYASKPALRHALRMSASP